MRHLLFLSVSTFLAAAAGANAPYTPGWLISVADYSHDWVRVSWDDDTCSTDPWIPQIFRDGKWETLATLASVSTRFTYTGLEAQTDYQLRVVHQEAPSQAITFRTPPEFIGPLAIKVENGNDVTVSWPSQPNADGYYVEWFRERDTITEFFYPAATGNTLINNPGTLSAAFDNLDVNESFTIRMHALLPGDERTGWIFGNAKTGIAAPEPFNALRTATLGTIRLTWQGVGILDEGYEIERSESDNTNYQPVTSAGTLQEEYLDISADPQKRYFYRIRSRENASTFSAWLEDDIWVSLPPAPAGLSATAVTDRSVTLTWSALPGIERYALERAEIPFTFWQGLGVAEGTEFVDGFDGSLPIDPGNTYRYRVKGITGDVQLGDTGWSLVEEVTTPSAAPASLDASLEGGGARIDLSWPDVFGEANYELDRRSGALAGSSLGAWTRLADPAANDTSESDTAVAGSMLYQYRIRSVNGAGASAWTESAVVGTSPGVPVNVTASPGSAPGANDCNTAITLRWNPVPGATGYVVRRSLSNGTEEEEFVISGGDVTSFTDSGLASFTVYKYRVKSTSGGADSVFGINRFERTCPWLSAITDASGSPVNVTWTDLTTQSVIPVSEYRLERRTAFSSWQQIATIPVADGPTYADSNVIPDATYSYRVRGWHPQDGGTFTPYSIIKDAGTPPPPVTGFSLGGSDGNSVTLRWDPALSAEEIQILRKTPADASFSLLATLPGTATSYTDTGLSPGEIYSYWIFINNANGENTGSMVTDFEVQLPSFPLTITQPSPNVASLDWDDFQLPRLDTYRVQQNVGVAGWEDVADLSAMTTDYLRDAACPGAEFRVLGLDAEGGIIARTEGELFPGTFLRAPAPIDPALPDTSITTEIQSTTSLFVSWGEVTGSSGYRLERRVGLDGLWATVAETADGVTSFVDTGLSSEELYYYRVSGVDGCGEAGPSSNTVQGTTIPVTYTFYTDRAEFQAAAGPLVTEGFNTEFASAQEIDYGPFLVRTPDTHLIYWANADTLPGFVSEGAGALRFFAIRPPGIGNNAAFFFSPRIRCFGIDIRELNSGLSVQADGEFPAFPAFSAGDSVPRFFGVISEIPFRRIVLAWPNAQESVGLDNLQYSATLHPPNVTIIAEEPGQMRIGWWPSRAGSMLQESETLLPDSWVDSPSGGTNPAVVPIDSARKFFRVAEP